MTPEQIQIAMALGGCNFLPASTPKRFARDMLHLAVNDFARELTEKQDKYLRDLAVRYRRQMAIQVVRSAKDTGTEPLTVLQWMAPELARLGVVRNEDWVPIHSAKACKLYRNAGMHTAAALIAAVHRYGYQYLEQAPVLALAFNDLGRAKDRERAARQIGGVLEKEPRLKDLMKLFGYPLPLRQIKGHALTPSYRGTLRRLAKINPSTLAQIIPVKGQREWLANLHRWTKQMETRIHEPGLFFEWAARNNGGSGDIADFAANNRAVFNEKWTFEQARAACERWHAELAQRTYADKFRANYGKEWDEEIDYGNLPSIAEHNGLTFVALRSGKTLHEEGAAMHHCVFSYTSMVMQGRSRIYSVRDGNERLATVDFNGGIKKIALSQAKGPCNAKPPTRVMIAIEAFMRDFNRKGA